MIMHDDSCFEPWEQQICHSIHKTQEGNSSGVVAYATAVNDHHGAMPYLIDIRDTEGRVSKLVVFDALK